MNHTWRGSQGQAGKTAGRLPRTTTDRVIAQVHGGTAQHQRTGRNRTMPHSLEESLGGAEREKQDKNKVNDPILATSQAAALPWNVYQSLLHRELQDKEITQKTACINRLRWIKHGTSADQSKERWERQLLKITRQPVFSQRMKLGRDLHERMW